MAKKHWSTETRPRRTAASRRSQSFLDSLEGNARRTRGILAAARRGGSGIYHLTNETVLPISELVRRVCGMLSKDFESVTKITGERLGQDTRYELDDSKARRELDWRPRVA